MQVAEATWVAMTLWSCRYVPAIFPHPSNRGGVSCPVTRAFTYFAPGPSAYLQKPLWETFSLPHKLLLRTEITVLDRLRSSGGLLSLDVSGARWRTILCRSPFSGVVVRSFSL